MGPNRKGKCVPRSAHAWLSIAAAALVFARQDSFADEGGVSFWLPGQFGSLVALPLKSIRQS